MDEDMVVDEDLEENQKKRKRDSFEVDLPQIGYVYDEALGNESSKLPNVSGRAAVVHSLIEAYDLLRNVTVYKCIPATEEELCNFHSSDYISYLKDINKMYTPDDDVELEYGLGYDCPPLDGIYDYCSAIAGSTLTAARALVRNEVEIAINWCGGWHHGQRYEAEGFCYVNDVILGILELRTYYDHILYIDLDVHHGNGVETCFEFTKRVFTLSVHQYEPGFYPGTGKTCDIGFGLGSHHCLNVPFREGIKDGNYCQVFQRVLNEISKAYSMDAVVVQCGADGLSGDPLGGFNLTEKAYGYCLKQIIKLKKPTLVLGGGGYNNANSARCWTYLTSVLIGVELSPDIPEHEYFSLYGPSFELGITPGNRKDLNDKEYLEKMLADISENLKALYDSRL